MQNVIKIGEDIGANGSNMQFVEAFGDTATLTKREKSGADTVVRLTNKSSDVSRGVFGYPPEFSDVEAGTQLTFTQKSRGGVEGGQVFTVKKVVTVIAADVPPAPPVRPTVTSVTATDGLPFEVGKDFAIRGTGLAEGEIRVGFHNAGVEYEERVLDGYVKSRTDTEIVIDGPESYADMEASCDGYKLMIGGEEVFNF